MTYQNFSLLLPYFRFIFVLSQAFMALFYA